MDSREILNLMVEDYKRLEEVEAIVLGGSSSVSNADKNSDFDIYILFKRTGY